MTEEQSKSSKLKRRLAVLGIVVAGLMSTAFVVWSATCPCERSPGGYLFGAGPDEAISDWSFANDVPLCQIQVGAALMPYSINLNCMSTSSGELYLSCSRCDAKRWAGIVVDDSTIRLRLEETVYPVTATRIMDAQELDRAWGARLDKLQVHSTDLNPAAPLGTPRPDRWWSFRLESR
jgi:hypothetical protein